MVDFNDQYTQEAMATDNEFTDDDEDFDDQSIENNTNYLNNNSHEAQEIADIFRQNIKKENADLTTMQVCQTKRDRIFPIMKFTSEEILCDIKSFPIARP